MTTPEEYSLGPGQLAGLGVAFAFLLKTGEKALEILVERFFRRGETEEAKRAAEKKDEEAKRTAEKEQHAKELSGIHSSIEAWREEIRDGFAELRSLINGQDKAVAELRIEQRHALERIAKLEERLDKIPDQIRESRHAIRNELTPLFAKVGRRNPDEEA